MIELDTVEEYRVAIQILKSEQERTGIDFRSSIYALKAKIQEEMK